MPLNLMTLTVVDRPVTLEEGLKILDRDQHRCRYCGLDGKASFENALVMSVDFVIPRAKKGKKDPENLVACCRPCNMIKVRGFIAIWMKPRLRPGAPRRIAQGLGNKDGAEQARESVAQSFHVLCSCAARALSG